MKYNSKIHVHFVDDATIKKLNKKYKGKNYATDVLSFHMDQDLPNGEYYIGDIIVNIDQAKRQMKDYDNEDVRLEVAQLVEHGVLHLLGIHHDHDDHE